MSKLYAVYNMKDYEQCIGVFDNAKQIADYFNMSKDSVLSAITKKNKIKHRYLVERIEDTEEHEEKFTIPVKKTDKEIFQELIDAFAPERHNFEIFDITYWNEKRRRDTIIIYEEWKKIEGYNYSVSNYGRIKNNTSQKIKALRNGIYGYQVNLWNKSQGKMFTLSRLVAHYFIRKVGENERVRHKDGDIRNNYYKNLEIVSK